MILSTPQASKLMGRKRPQRKFSILRWPVQETKPDAKGHPKVAILNFVQGFGCLLHIEHQPHVNAQPYISDDGRTSGFGSIWQHYLTKVVALTTECIP